MIAKDSLAFQSVFLCSITKPTLWQVSGSSQYSAKNIGEQLICYINLGQCYLGAGTVPIFKLCCAYRENGHFRNSSKKRRPEGRDDLYERKQQE